MTRVKISFLSQRLRAVTKGSSASSLGSLQRCNESSQGHAVQLHTSALVLHGPADDPLRTQVRYAAVVSCMHFVVSCHRPGSGADAAVEYRIQSLPEVWA